uniref:Uncharacterized protein n=1 Tax=Anopheles maculatus TaxID=74869 RepID=A0A182SZ48_9DIPT
MALQTALRRAQTQDEQRALNEGEVPPEPVANIQIPKLSELKDLKHNMIHNSQTRSFDCDSSTGSMASAPGTSSVPLTIHRRSPVPHHVAEPQHLGDFQSQEALCTIIQSQIHATVAFGTTITQRGASKRTHSNQDQPR